MRVSFVLAPLLPMLAWSQTPDSNAERTLVFTHAPSPQEMNEIALAISGFSNNWMALRRSSPTGDTSLRERSIL